MSEYTVPNANIHFLINYSLIEDLHEHLQKMMSHGRPYMALRMIDTKTKVFTMLKLWGYQNEM